MDHNNVIRLGIIGCGGISQSHGKAARDIPDKVKFVACCDIRQEAAKAWAEQYGCDGIYTDYQKMVQSEDLDGIVIATWPNQHREHIEKCLDLAAAAASRSIEGYGRSAYPGREFFEMVFSRGRSPGPGS